MFIKNVQRWMMPYLRNCEKRRPHSFYSLLREYLVAIATDDLTLPVLLFKASKADVSSGVLLSVFLFSNAAFMIKNMQLLKNTQLAKWLTSCGLEVCTGMGFNPIPTRPHRPHIHPHTSPHIFCQ